MQDEALKRAQENDNALSDVFEPYGTSYTKSGDSKDAGRPLDPNTKPPDKQIDDKARNDVTK